VVDLMHSKLYEQRASTSLCPQSFLILKFLFQWFDSHDNSAKSLCGLNVVSNIGVTTSKAWNAINKQVVCI